VSWADRVKGIKPKSAPAAALDNKDVVKEPLVNGDPLKENIAENLSFITEGMWNNL